MPLRETFDPVWASTVPKGEDGERWASYLFAQFGYEVEPHYQTQPWPKAVGQKYDLVVTKNGNRPQTVEVTHDCRAPDRRKGRVPHVCFQTEEMGKPTKVAGTADLYAHIVGVRGEMYVWKRERLLHFLKVLWRCGVIDDFDEEMGTARSRGLRVPLALLPVIGFIGVRMDA